jgi:hypothetical protein
MLKLYVVWIHRQGNLLKVQCGLVEHQGPSRTFRITDRDSDNESFGESDSYTSGEHQTQTEDEDEDENAEEDEDADADEDAEADEDADAIEDPDNDAEEQTADDAEEQTAEQVGEAEAADELETDEHSEYFHHLQGPHAAWRDFDSHFHDMENVTKYALRARVERWLKLQNLVVFPMLTQLE